MNGMERRIEAEAMGVRYSIRNWKERFERAQNKPVKSWNWVPIPNKHDGLGFRRIMAMPDGMVIYGAWCLIVQVASKCPLRGVLADENGPLDATDLALKTGGQKAAFELALSALSDNKIGWILLERYERPTTPLSAQDRTEQNTTEPNPTESNAVCDGDASVDTPDDDSLSPEEKPRAKHSYSAAFEKWYAGYPVKEAKQKAAAAFGRAVTRIAAARDCSRQEAMDWLEGITAVFAASPKASSEYVPHPATWLNEGRYDDDPARWNRTGGSRQQTTRVGRGQRFDANA